MTDASLRPFNASDVPWLVARHAALYTQADGFDASFGPLVAEILQDFSANHDPSFEAGWILTQGSRRCGSIFCVRLDATTAKLRLFLIEPDLRGQGLGRRMLAHCMGFARHAGYARMQLWTHESHRAACALYAATGWTLVRAENVLSFGCDLIEQSWKIDL